ncbi:hypothetical protein [Cytobacillus dafuensis]|uniref:Lipoprotein n=1 Tax=Cytobacillus dafuensis TaxID=1742359 RepID=A0A5B8Z044_CYTDA|nr:hypothetical protein [Cytobacillus dafuensis]QED46077.1 hypothetical protein FSZ17_01445 [Cytobacillus dafuensis]
MNIIKNISILVILMILLSSCSTFRPLSGCPDSEIEWVDMVMINDIKYQHHFPDQTDGNIPLSIEKGSEIGKVTYKMADSACSNHKTKNGDAAYLEKGTPIFEIKGYPSSFVVVANDRVFVAEENKKAKTAGELYAMDQLVKNIYIESTEDGSRMHTFSQSSKDKFLDAWYQLKLEDVEKLYKEGKQEGKRVFLEIELNNGVTFRELYWADSNTFHSGAIGNKEIKEIIDHELSKKK